MWRASMALVFWMFWHWACLVEVFLSTGVHMTYAAVLVCCALFGDVVKIVKNEALPLQVPTKSRAPPVVETEAELAAAPAMGISGNIPISAGELVRGPIHGGKHGQKHVTRSKNGFTLAPIVLVHGIFGFGHGRLGSLSYFGGAELKDENVLVPDLGSLSSYHDRACELFYYLKGGTVDFGLEHSAEFGHERFGKTYSVGHFPEWDENHPIHFVGHSSGVQTVRLLQAMLAEKKFSGWEGTNEDWVASITSLSGALNGTTRVYIDGIKSSDGHTLQRVSLLQVLRVGVLLYDFLDLPALKVYYSFGFDHFRMSWRNGGVLALARRFLNLSGPFASGDWILPDLSLQSTLKLNSRLKTFPNTFYFSYATVKTRRIMGLTLPADLTIHPLFVIRALQMSQWQHPRNLPLPYDGYRDEDWQDNDGALNTISMLYPRLPHVHPHTPLTSEVSARQFQPGIWYYTLLDADHISFIISRKRAGIHFDVLYDSIFERCRRHLARETLPLADQM